jgi:hypothetical protein
MIARGQVRLVVADHPNGAAGLLSDPDTEKAQRVMAAMLEMKKIDIDELERAAASGRRRRALLRQLSVQS